MIRLPTRSDLKDRLPRGSSPQPEGRLRRHKVADAVALGSALGLIVGLAHMPGAARDLQLAYIPAADAQLDHFYNPYWARPIFELLAAMPIQIAYAVLMAASLVALVLATGIFGGSLAFVLLTYQFGAVLYFGQVDAFVVLGLAASWWALERKNPWIAGIGFSLASLKPQTSLPALLLLWWWHDGPGKVKSLVVPFLVVLASFWRYGWWLPDWLSRLQGPGLMRLGSITLWEHMGPLALLLWIPALLARLPRKDKLLLFLATAALTMPYYQQKALVSLQVFPIGWVAWLGNIGFLFPLLGGNILEGIVLVPMIVYGRRVWTGWRNAHLARAEHGAET